MHAAQQSETTDPSVALGGRLGVETCAVTALSAAALVWFLWPHLAQVRASIPDAAAEGNLGWGADTRLILWILSWDLHALATQPLALFDANILQPATNTLAGSEHLLASLLLFGPIALLTGNTVLAGNLTVVLTYLLAAVLMYLLLRRLGLDAASSLIGAVALPIGPYRVPVDFHVLQYPNFVLPMVVLTAQAAKNGRPVSFCCATTIGVLSSFYVAAMALAVVTIEITLAVFTDGTRAARRLLLATMPSVIVLILVSIPYREYLKAVVPPRAGDFAVLAQLEFQALISNPSDPTTGPGFMLLLLGSAGLIAPFISSASRSSRWIRWVVILFVALVIAIGPELRIGSIVIPMPVSLVSGTSLDFFRNYPRFLILAHFGLVGLAGEGMLLLQRVLTKAGAGRLGWALRFPVLAVALWGVAFPRVTRLADRPLTSLRIAGSIPEVYRFLQTADRGPLLEVPGPSPNHYLASMLLQADTMLWSTTHWLPMLNGHTGHAPWWADALATEMTRLPDTSVAQSLVDLAGLRWILVRRERVGDASFERWIKWAERESGRVKARSFGDDDLLLDVGFQPRRPWAALLARGTRNPAESVLGTSLAPLPQSADRGRLQTMFPVAAPNPVNPGAELRLPITVRNLSDHDWPAMLPPDARAEGLVVLVASWSDDGGVVARENDVTRLPFDVMAGGAVFVTVVVRAPTSLGRYVLEVRLRQVRGLTFAQIEPLHLQIGVGSPA